jgi:mannose-1-phosphate guanylyltransferase
MSSTEEISVTERDPSRRSHWCVVVADDHGPEWVPTVSPGKKPASVQYCGLGEPTTLLQKALHRAARIAPASQVMVTAIDGHREHWQPALWSVRPPHRFVGDSRSTSCLTMAAALLSVAAASPQHVVTVIPAKCYVAHEDVLFEALQSAYTHLPLTPEGVITLGMIDIPDGIDEDYLVPGRAKVGSHWVVQAMARRPVPWVVRHLREHGAMSASGILIGHAGVFAAHVAKQWPGLTVKLTRAVTRAVASGTECRVPAALRAGVPGAVLRSLGWCAPAFPQRVLRVQHAGWSGLRSPRAVARISAMADQYPGSTARRPNRRVESGELMINGHRT